MAGVEAMVEKMVREALLLDRQGRVIEAVAAYRSVLARWPALKDCWYRLAALERQTRQYAAALNSYRQALDHGIGRPEEVHLNRSVIYAEDLHDNGSAERELGTALELSPAYIPALLNLASLHEDVGRRDDALRTYEHILALDPENRMALARYANASTGSSLDGRLVERLTAALANATARPDERADLYFALGRILDIRGEYSNAFEAYRAANHASRLSVAASFAPYDRAVQESLFSRLIAAFPAISGVASESATDPDPRSGPVFICGMFRSGSTLLEQLLAGHPRVTAGGELDLLPHIAQSLLAPFPEAAASALPAQLSALRAQYLHEIKTLFPGAQFVTDKRPDNFMYIGLIKRLFPHSKIVHTQRNALDNILSVYFLHLDHRMNYAFDLMDIAHYHRQYRRLMQHWRISFGWDIIDVDYDELVTRPRAVMENLCMALGLEWDDGCLSVPSRGQPVKTASVWQVREPVHARSSGRARHYAHELAAVREYLERP